MAVMNHRLSFEGIENGDSHEIYTRQRWRYHVKRQETDVKATARWLEEGLSSSKFRSYFLELTGEWIPRFEQVTRQMRASTVIPASHFILSIRKETETALYNSSEEKQSPHVGADMWWLAAMTKGGWYIWSVWICLFMYIHKGHLGLSINLYKYRLHHVHTVEAPIQ